MTKEEFACNEVCLFNLMLSLGISIDDNTKDTPRRLLKMWKELFSSVNADVEEFKKTLTLFPAPSMQPVTVKDIPFHSTCAHHFMPFFGKAYIKYEPVEKIIGLSKIPRIINFCAKKPQVQENLTQEIGEMIVDVIKPLKVEVELYDVTHTCMSCRGVESFAQTDTIWTYVDEDYYDEAFDNSWDDESIKQFWRSYL